jgi:hypothetical protein
MTERNCYFIVEHATTSDMDDGRPLPPLIEGGIVWHVVYRSNSQTKWRRIFLKKSPATISRATPPGARMLLVRRHNNHSRNHSHE